MTSASTQVVTDIEVRMPKIVFCLAEPFKSGKFPETLEEYINITYSMDEVIGYVSASNVTEIGTFMYGRCFILEIEDSPKETEFSDEIGILVGFKTTREIKMYLIDHGQDFCVVNSVIKCYVPLQGIALKPSLTDIRIKPKKYILEERYVRQHCKYQFVLISKS